MSNWPESNSSDIENQCTSTHPEDPEIRCGRTAAHNFDPAPVHANVDGHWWILEPCTFSTIIWQGSATPCELDRDHEGNHKCGPYYVDHDGKLVERA